MKKIAAVLLTCTLLLAGCGTKEKNIVFTGVILEIYDNGILVETADLYGSDKASVSFDKDIEGISFNFLAGQTVELTILPQIRESYPVQVTAVKIKLIQQAQEDETMSSTISEQLSEYKKITPEEAKKIIDGEQAFTLLDVRMQDEFDEGHIEGAMLVPDIELAEKAPEALPDKDATILVYCRSGRRSEASAKELVGMGYKNVLDFGGIIDWPYQTTK